MVDHRLHLLLLFSKARERGIGCGVLTFYRMHSFFYCTLHRSSLYVALFLSFRLILLLIKINCCLDVKYVDYFNGILFIYFYLLFNYTDLNLFLGTCIWENSRRSLQIHYSGTNSQSHQRQRHFFTSNHFLHLLY